MEGLVSRSGSVKKFEFLRPFSKATEKTEKKSCFSLDQLTENEKFVCNKQQCFAFQSSNVDNFLPDLDINSSIFYQIFRTLMKNENIFSCPDSNFCISIGSVLCSQHYFYWRNWFPLQSSWVWIWTWSISKVRPTFWQILQTWTFQWQITFLRYFS